MKSIGSTGLAYLWGKIKSIFATKTELAGHPTGRIYYGTCSTTANTYVKEATVETFPLDANNKPLVGTVVAIKFTVTNTYKTEGQTYALNVNNTGEYPMYYNNAAVATSTSANTLVAGYKNRHVFYVFNGTQWVWLSASYDANTTYSGMTQDEINAGTSTTARLITPARLMDNFYTEGEVDTLLADKADSADLADVAFSGSYNDLDNTPTIPTVPSNVSAFNNDAGYITGYTETDPVFAASAAHGITSSDVANWNGKQAAIDDLADIRSGAALGATALQSFTESDPTVPAWAKQSTKPSYTASEVGALPDTTVIPAAPGTLNTTATTAQSTNSSEALSGNITLHKVAKTGTYSDLIGKPAIPTVPTALSAFTDDLGSNPTHTHSQYLISAPVTSVNGQTGAVSLTIPDVSGKADKVVVVNAATLPASLEPNKVYQMGTLTGSVTIPAFASVASGDTEVKIWCFTFSTSSTAPTITWPAGITAWNGGDAPEINADKSYEVSVMDGIGVIIEA